MPAVIAIPLILGATSAAASIAKAKIESNAAKKAADAMTHSQNRALATNQQVYNDQRALMNPYISRGNQAYAQFMAGRGLPVDATGGQGPGAYTGQGGRGVPLGAMPMGGGPMPPGPAIGGRPNPAAMGGGAYQQAMGGGAPMPGGQPSGAMVKIQSPDGEVRPVPQEQAQHYISMGGRVVG